MKEYLDVNRALWDRWTKIHATSAFYDVERFAVVFTSYGVLPWLPDLTAWAQVIADFLKPGHVLHRRVPLLFSIKARR